MELNEMQKITKDYFSNFCQYDLDSDIPDTITYICTDKRDEALEGYGRKYSIYLLELGGKTIITYSPHYRNTIEKLKDPEEIIKALDLKGLKLFIFSGEKVSNLGNARVLEKGDYSKYYEFFTSAHPDAQPDGWLEEYYIDQVEKRYFTGYEVDGKLVCVSDAPSMPYMEGVIQHTGIATLPQYRRKGYAKATAGLATHNLISMGICPQWECDLTNEASIALARSIGYEDFGTAYVLIEK